MKRISIAFFSFLMAVIAYEINIDAHGQGGTMHLNSLVKEIVADGPPDKSGPKIITHIVNRYISIGMEKGYVISVLKQQGFLVREESDARYQQCKTCDPIAVLAGYVIKGKNILMPDESYITMRIEFSKGVVKFISASHVKNVF